eukprot:1178342-Prymnesium_polylepis.1
MAPGRGRLRGRMARGLGVTAMACQAAHCSLRSSATSDGSQAETRLEKSTIIVLACALPRRQKMSTSSGTS